MRNLIASIVIASWLPMSAAVGAESPSKARVCIERESQNGSLNVAPTILSLRSLSSGKTFARKRFDDTGSLCALVPGGRYILSVRFAEPWARSFPLRWWNREFPIDLGDGDAKFVMTNPPKNDEFQAMIAGRDGWHRLWPVHRVR